MIDFDDYEDIEPKVVGYVLNASTGELEIETVAGAETFNQVFDGESPGFFQTPFVGNYNYLFNGVDWDRKRANTQETVLASASRSATLNSADFINYNALGVHIAFDLTVVPGGDTVTPILQAKDPVSGKYYDLLVGPALIAAGLVILKLYPGITPSALATASDILPRIWRVRVEHSAASAFTYSIGANVVL